MVFSASKSLSADQGKKKPMIDWTEQKDPRSACQTPAGTKSSVGQDGGDGCGVHGAAVLPFTGIVNGHHHCAADASHFPSVPKTTNITSISSSTSSSSSSSCDSNKKLLCGDDGGAGGLVVFAGSDEGDESGDTLPPAISPPLANLRQLMQPKLKLDLKKSYEYKPKR